MWTVMEKGVRPALEEHMRPAGDWKGYAAWDGAG